MKHSEEIIKNLEDETDAVLITSLKNRRYLSKFNSHSGYFFITKDQSYLIVDFRYYESAKNSVKNSEVVLFSNFVETIKKLCDKHKIKTVLGEHKHLTLESFEKYNFIFSSFGVKFLSSKKLDKLIVDMRMIKSKEEIAKIKEAQRISEEAFWSVVKNIKPGISEKQIATQIELFMIKNEASQKSFDLITVSGENTSLPHGEPTNREIKKGDLITIDIGAVFEGYCSDMTRTLAVGKISEEQEKIYDIVLRSNLEGIRSAKPGVKASDVDKASRNVIEKEGYEKFFGHATGHGVGLEVHEGPRLSFTDTTVLKEGMVVTVEPGIYLPKKFGIRIEDMIVITKDACCNLTSIQKELIVLQ